MSRSTLISSLRRAYKIARTSINIDIPPEELLDIFNQKTSRRLLYGGLALTSAIVAKRTAFGIAAATWESERNSVS